MDIQSTLNWLIQVLVMGFVSIMVLDFVNGLFQLPYSEAIATTPVTTPVSTPVFTPAPEFAPTPDPWKETQFTQLPDPWELTEIQPTIILPQAVVLPFPALRLLPPVAEVQPNKTKTKPKSTKTTKTKASKPTTKTATKTASKSRKKAA